jgi:hypothetical protein
MMRDVNGFKTRTVGLDDGQRRDFAQNMRTGVLIADQVPKASFSDLFRLCYSDIRRVCQSFALPGVAVVAIDIGRRRLSGSLCIAAKPGHANSAIIGRHGMADLFLEGDPAMSLRHMAVLVYPLRDWENTGGGDVRYRVLDLRTRTAFEDEQGQRLEAVAAEGPIFLRCGGYALMFFVTGDLASWSDDANAAWSAVPERVYLHEHVAEPDRWARNRRAQVAAQSNRQASGGGAARVTMVQASRGPSRARLNLLAAEEPALGRLELSNGKHVQSLLIGRYAADEGILLGRYDRCDTGGASVFDHPSLSRVHCLVIDLDGVMYAVDTASTNGTYLSGHEEEVRIVSLSGDRELVLGDDLLRMQWEPRALPALV